jgi:hypothetical protein
MPESKKPEPRILIAALIAAVRNEHDSDDAAEKVNALALALEFGRLPRPGYELARTIFGKVFEEAEGTSFACSPRSEAYWCS